MAWLIVYQWRAGQKNRREDRSRRGMLLASYDPDAHCGHGEASWTATPDMAMWFDSPDAAYEFWHTQSTARPLRDDGKPNRPLTAYTVSIQQL